MRFADLAATLDDVRSTRSRTAKTETVAAALRAAGPDEVELVASYLMGALRQRRTGVGWRSLTDLPAPATEPSLSVGDVDDTFEDLARLAGPGSQSARRDGLEGLFARATEAEQALLRGLVTGEVRTGALEGVLVDAVARAYDVPKASVRRAVMLSGSAPVVADVAAEAGEAGLSEVGLQLMRPAQPMLAASASDLAGALDQTGLPALVDAKLDGIRVQVHRDGDRLGVWSRSLDDLTARFPELVERVRSYPGSAFVLDGEALLVGEDGRPRAFQDTASRAGTRSASDLVLSPYFFDVLHLDGRDLLDEPVTVRTEALHRLVPAEDRVERRQVESLEEATEFWTRTLSAGQEGVVVKSLDSRWEAGRRGSGWVKVKPRHTLDLVVLAVEWGGGRRQGWLSNIHLGARDDSAPTGFTMLGKTFKGMTDETLTWQTERFLGLETHREGHVVHVRPEQVVEIAFDGLQRSTRYPGGLALRFARVLGYREDKSAHQADTIETVRALA